MQISQFQHRTGSGRATNEGDDLFYEVRGQGPPLLMICGGGGDSWWYYPLADLLARHYRVITYDRRANARSTSKEPLNFEISQQSRDALAVLRAAGENRAVVFGSSSGAIIGLDLAKRHPEAVRLLVAHEPPLLALLKNAARWRRSIANVYKTSLKFGTTAAALRFALLAGLPIGQMAQAAKLADAFKKEHSAAYVSAERNAEVSMEVELLPAVNYIPDVAALKENEVRVVVAVGEESLRKKRFYAEASQALAAQLGASLVPFPGNHLSFFHMANEWAATLHRVLLASESR